jgi:hypothetical protein
MEKKQNQKIIKMSKKMILPIELIRAILKFNRDDYFLVSMYSFCLVALKKLHAIPKPKNYRTSVELKLDLPKVGKLYVFRFYHGLIPISYHGLIPISSKFFE